MTPVAVKRARQLAAEFMLRCDAVLKPSSSIDPNNLHLGWVEAGKESGALRRASMELTRALAEMRRPK